MNYLEILLRNAEAAEDKLRYQYSINKYPDIKYLLDAYTARNLYIEAAKE